MSGITYFYMGGGGDPFVMLRKASYSEVGGRLVCTKPGLSARFHGGRYFLPETDPNFEEKRDALDTNPNVVRSDEAKEVRDRKRSLLKTPVIEKRAVKPVAGLPDLGGEGSALLLPAHPQNGTEITTKTYAGDPLQTAEVNEVEASSKDYE
jgi:hypothetical protein